LEGLDSLKKDPVVKTFNAKDGRKIILRNPRLEDLDDLLGLINSLVEEDADIHRIEKVTKEQEKVWLEGSLLKIKKRQLFDLVVEVDGKVVGNSELKIKTGRSSHVGYIGIVIKKGYRDIGIGNAMLKALIFHAETIGLMMLTLDVFSTNNRAIHVYEKLGFKETGRIPKKLVKNGKYVDEILMVKNLASFP
jgi:RimJ/RimL family protein N-acetyltransferase